MWFDVFPFHFFCTKMQNASPFCHNLLQLVSICYKSCQICTRSLQVSGVRIFISSSSFGIHLYLIFLEYYSGAKYYLPTLHILAFMQEAIAAKLQAFLVLGNIVGFAPLNIKAFPCSFNFVELSVCHKSAVYQIRGVFI